MKVLMEDIPYDLQKMVEIVGVEKFLEICKMYGGLSIYIPLYKMVIKASRNREIVQSYNGKNAKDLVYKYGISYQQIKNILRNEGK